MPVVSSFGSLTLSGTDVDNYGNFYSIFRAKGDIDINPTQDTSSITTLGFSDLVIQKTDSTGELIWAKQISGEPNRQVTGQNIKCDTLGNIIVIGDFTNTVDFDPDTSHADLNSNGQKDVFILKMDTAGNFVWVKKLGGLNSELANGLTIDGAANIYVTGTFYDSIDLDPGLGVLMNYSNGLKDFFIVKIAPNGHLIWAKNYGGIGSDYCNSVETDSQSNLVLTGSYSGLTYFDSTDSTQVLTGSQSKNLFVLKLDSSGGFIWVRGTQPSNNIIGNGLSFDSIGNIYVSGIFDEYANFDTASASTLYTSERMDFDVYDSYILKLRSNGDFVWVKGFQGYGANSVSSPVFTTNNDMIISGSFTNLIDVDPSSFDYIFTGSAYTSMFIERLDSLGSFIWASPFYGTNLCVGNPILLTQNKELFIGGSYNGLVDFDPGMNSSSYTSQNGTNAYFLKLKPCYYPSPVTNISVTSCNNFTWTNGVTYTSSTNQARQVFTNVAGCDSLVNLDLTILPSGVHHDTVFTCDSVIWIDGNTYYQTDDSASIITIPNGSSNGCDSLVILNLINQSNGSIFNEDACNEYTWLNGVTYFVDTDNPELVFSNEHGCDSIVRLNLRLFPYDTTIVQTDSMTLFATYTQGIHYQWYSCNEDSILPGETYRSFKAKQAGNYAVIYNRPNRCTDTSSCFWLAPVGMKDLNASPNGIIIYPNPAKNKVTVDLQEIKATQAKIEIINLSGQVIYQERISKQPSFWSTQIDVSSFSSGFYFLKVTTDENEYTFKLSKY